MSRCNTFLFLTGIAVLLHLAAAMPKTAASASAIIHANYPINLTGEICCGPGGFCVGSFFKPIADTPLSLVCNKSGAVETIAGATTNINGSFNMIVPSADLVGVSMFPLGPTPCNVTTQVPSCLFLGEGQVVSAPVTVVYLDPFIKMKYAIAKPFFKA